MDRYLFIVGEFEWAFDEFIDGYQKAMAVGKQLRRLRIRPDGVTTLMSLWHPTSQHRYAQDRTFLAESLDQDYGMGPY